MARKRSPSKSGLDGLSTTSDYRHEQTRLNLPNAAMAGEGTTPKQKAAKYAYSPHLDPVLRFDPTGRADKVQGIVDKACRGERLDAGEQEILRAVGKNWEQPWLEWANKQEEHARGHFSVDPVALHIHERISAQAILRAAQREDTERSLFASPEQSYSESLKFYKHDVDWANRLILGDSLQVMSSLAHRENLAGRVQMIYMDPPYGIKFRSNFQPEINSRQVTEDNSGFNREPELVRAYRDSWHLGRHSYASYLRHRLETGRRLLSESGSIFLQIGDDNVQLARTLLDEVFGSENFRSQIAFTKGGSGLETAYRLSARLDYLLWYAKDASLCRFNKVYSRGSIEETSTIWAENPAGFTRRTDKPAEDDRIFVDESLTKPGPGARYEVDAFGRSFNSGGRWWGSPRDAMCRAIRAERVMQVGNTIRRRKYLDESTPRALTNLWDGIGGPKDPIYAVQTNESVIERCILMTSGPGDLVLDPTSGSGTAAFAAEKLGRRWIAIDSSRVAIALARHRLLTGMFEHYKTQGGPCPPLGSENPASGFQLRVQLNVTFSSVSQNTALDPIFAKHEPILAAKLKAANDALAVVPASLRATLKAKLDEKQKSEGKKSITDADRRRWILPPDNRDPKEKWTVDAKFAGWYDWEVPFDTDPAWPKPLQDAVTAYRAAWRAKMDEVNACIAANADQEELVDQPEVVKGVVRVSGPFTVEGVIPEELSMTDEGLVDYTPNEDEDGSDPEASNRVAYLDKMIAHVRRDGVKFPNNQHRKFQRVDRLYDAGTFSGIHAEAPWEGEDEAKVAIVFGPQYGPLTALQTEDALRAARRYEHVVLAGFSFAPEVSLFVQQNEHPKQKVHLAHIRPDLNPGMDGLLKDTPNSELFTVFGMPSIQVRQAKDGDWTVELEGVDIYDPVRNEVRSTKADKVSAWFLDTDFDGRCFCACQAFFPNQNAWEKIAKALGSEADEAVFEAFQGTVSVPFKAGQYQRVAIKVIDHRGSEVMAVRKLEA